MNASPQRPASPLISCVIPAYNESKNIGRFLPALYRELCKHSSQLELIVVNDGSQDDTTTQTLLASGDLPIRLIDFSRNFGKEAALTAGIDHADGDIVILIDADFQHPIDVIGDFIREWRAGYDMVYGIRVNRQGESGLKRHGAKWFYWLLDRLSSIDMPADAGDFRLMDRRVIQALRQLPERNRFMKGLYSWVGYSSTSVSYQAHERLGGETSFSFRKLWKLAVTGLVSFSVIPLRMWTVIGLIVSGISFLYALWVVFKTLLWGADTSGWPTIVVAIMFLGGVQLISIGVLGEYIGRIFNEVKQRPIYLVKNYYGFERATSPQSIPPGAVETPKN